MITTIIFDLAEVYLQGIVGVEKHLEPILKIKDDKIHELLKGQNFIDLMEGKISEEEYLNNIISKNNLKVNLDELKKAIRKNFQEIEGTREIIEKLKDKGFKLGLLSVHSKEWIDHCEKQFDFHKLFHSTLYSFEVSVCKPDKKAYHLILEKLKAKPEECLFIDDSEKNIEAAKNIGLKTILFKNPTQLKKDLDSLSIDIN